MLFISYIILNLKFNNMKQITFGILIGIALTAIFSFQKVESIFTIKPAKPKIVIIKIINSNLEKNMGALDLMQIYISKKYNEGYILKSQSVCMYSNDFSTGLVIMEKY